MDGTTSEVRYQHWVQVMQDWSSSGQSKRDYCQGKGIEEVPLSNNAAENAIRPFVIGRKNWLFCKSDDGATAAADAYSIVETAKANGLDVLKYLDFIFRLFPMADGNLSDDFLETLMPWCDKVVEVCKRGCI